MFNIILYSIPKIKINLTAIILLAHVYYLI